MTMDIQKVVNSAIEYAQELIRTPSLSGEEKDIAYKIRDYLRDIGSDKVFIDELGNVIATIKGFTEDAIVFEGHMDHVPPGNIKLWKYNPYSAKIIDGKLYGRGSVDMKAAIASMIAAASILAQKENSLTLHLIFVVHEETVEGAALRQVFDKHIERDRIRLVILGEASNLNLAIGHRGRCLVEVHLQGKTAHASMPEHGINPIEALSEFIQQLNNNVKPKLPYHPKLGKATITPTIIESRPKSTPQIPDECKVILDRRMVLREHEKDIIKPILAIIEYLKRKRKIMDGHVSIMNEELRCWTGFILKCHDFFPSWILEENDPLVLRLLKVLKTIRKDTKTYIWKFSTDGVFTAGTLGIKTIGLGPGKEELAHQPNEYVEISDMKVAIKSYIEICNTINEMELKGN